MNKQGRRAGEIRLYILSHIKEHPGDIVRAAATQFGTSRQAIARHLRRLVDEGLLTATGITNRRQYQPKTLAKGAFEYPITPALAEDVVWREKVRPLLNGVANNVVEICQYGFTEILNNALVHSGSASVGMTIERDVSSIEMGIIDRGVGIFNKIQREFNLNDPRHALLELAKGKLTTEAKTHTGEGIFFTSRMFDVFSILSGKLYFRASGGTEDWLIEGGERDPSREGTAVWMDISPYSTRTTTGVFDRYAPGQAAYDFSRTHVPVKLARYGDEQLVSRSQARRVLARFERFKEVILDFAGVATIGHSFADEIFRVFRHEHPEIAVLAVNTTPEIREMINRVSSKDS